MELNFGAFSTVECSTDGHGNYDEFSFQFLGGPSSTVNYGALSNGVAVDLGQFSKLDITRTDFLTGARVEVVNLAPGASPEVITFWNSPIGDILGNMSMTGTLVPHFELMYKVIAPPPSPLLVPRMKKPHPNNANITCPPAQIKP